IFPIAQIIEFVFVFAEKIFKETGLSVIAISAAISVLTLPLYAVADHGSGSNDHPNNITLPNGGTLQAYNPLLMVKDFGADSVAMAIDNSFMTNADTPFFALRGIIENPVNPWTQLPLTPDKDAGIAITTIGALSSYRHSEYRYNIAPNQWLHVRDNIFDAKNWENGAPAE
ncbi:MAG: hypothetical protein LBS64_04570, partial [Spirochaetaceae bacterium]|nr:hypothetical protein [Spirochaetaceae bacterium]